MAAASFNLRKWNSNSYELLGRIREAELQGLKRKLSPVINESTPDASPHNTMIGLGKACTESEVSKLLGITWNSQSDEFLFGFSELIEHAQELSVTKRSLLKVTARIFDPLGLISPFVRYYFRRCVLNQLRGTNHSRVVLLTSGTVSCLKQELSASLVYLDVISC